MTEISLRVENTSNISNSSFINLFKTIGIGIVGIRQAKLILGNTPLMDISHGACGIALGLHTGRVECAVA